MPSEPAPADNARVNIQLYSDLHLESNPHFRPEPLPGADLLVLAGDIGSYQKGSLLAPDPTAQQGSPFHRDFGLARFSPLPASEGGAGWPTPVLFVPGNHEYDALDFDEAHTLLRQTCERLGIIWLERESVVLDGIRFVGTTLWSDFEALEELQETQKVEAALACVSRRSAKQAKKAGHDMGSAEDKKAKRREKTHRAANFYLKKTETTYRGAPMLAEQVHEQALICQTWLRQALAEPFEGKTVVITHFAPSLMSADPRYGFTPGTAGFCNSLDHLLPHAALWLHGHLHCPVDYVKNGCRVVANPLGYARKGEQEGFRPQLRIPA